MIREVGGTLDPTGLHVGIAVASWNQSITDRLLSGAWGRLENLGVEKVTLLRVPGALELPLGVRALIDKGCDAVIAIGAVVKGETDHYDTVVRESAGGILRVSTDRGVPVTNAILAVHDVVHALDRSGPDDANKGVEAVDAAIMMANALRGLADD